jgi:hypothetical protein
VKLKTKIAIFLISLVLLDFGLKTWEMHQLVNSFSKNEQILEQLSKDLVKVSARKTDFYQYAVDYKNASRDASVDIHLNKINIERINIWPFHNRIQETREDLVSYYQATYKQLVTVGPTVTEFTQEKGLYLGDSEDVKPTFKQLEVSFDKSIPLLDPFRFHSKVTKLLEARFSE